jgi:hypothetical protein
VEVPVVPLLPNRPLRDGDAYTVWGAGYLLRSRAHRGELDGKSVTLVGYIVKTNLPDTPRCLIHPSGQADPENCSAPFPAFWLADSPHGALDDSIKVMGWASNYAQIYQAIRTYDSPRGGDYSDEYWGIRLPNPLPAVGAKVRVTGQYGPTFSGASSGTESDPNMGVLSYRSMEVLEPARELATLPGVRRKH